MNALQIIIGINKYIQNYHTKLNSRQWSSHTEGKLHSILKQLT